MKNIVSIIVPCYNQAQYLGEALQSILGQTYTHWECIIVNDGSQDCIEEIAKQWVEKDSRFVYLKKENGGLSSARNLGLENAKGDYIQFLDCDDCLEISKLFKSIMAIMSHCENNVIVTNFKMFKEHTQDDLGAYCKLSQDLLSYSNILYGWDFKFNIPIHCGLFSASLLKDFRFPEELKAKEDWIMWLFIFQKEMSAIFIDEALAFYRSHNKSMTKDSKHMFDNTIKALECLEEFLPDKDYKSYLLYFIVNKVQQYENLKDKVVNSNNSIGFRIEKKIRNFFKKCIK